MSRRWSRVREFGLGVALAACAASALAQSGAPLPRCPVGQNGFYLTRFTNSTGAGLAPMETVARVTLSGTTATQSVVWSGLAAPTVQAGDVAAAGASVAAGMGNDGYIYAIRATHLEPAITPWNTNLRRIEVLRYGADGVDNLGPIQNMPLAARYEAGDNFNAADIDPVTGDLILGMLRTDGGSPNLPGLGPTPAMQLLYRIKLPAKSDPTGKPTYDSVLKLSQPVPLARSGDFAISPDGTMAYGVATTTSNFALTPTLWSANLTTGVVNPNIAVVGSILLGGFYSPAGGAAWLPDGTLAFYSDPTGRVLKTNTDGTNRTLFSGLPSSDGADATRCLPELPKLSLTCAPSPLVDAADNVATCTITSDQLAPAGGLSVGLTLPTASDRYTTSCKSPIVIAATQSTAQCTITATPNTVPGDGSATASLALATPAAGAGYTLATNTTAQVVVNDDDRYTASLTCLPATLTDSPGQVSTCTVAIDAPAPATGLPISLIPPAANARYTGTCGSSVTIAAGAQTAACTITATPNTVPGDGAVTASVALAAPAPGSVYMLGTPSAAQVVVRDDDLYSASLNCTPVTLTDSPSQVSVCTVTLSAPAPTGGLNVGITPPPTNPRYSTTCGSSVVVAAGAQSASCTITATPNTDPNDGDVTAPIALSAPAAGAAYTLGTPTSAGVLIRNDDLVSASLTCTPAHLTDAPNQVSTCTVVLSAPTPAAGMSIALIAPPASGRYTTTCGAALTVVAGAQSATCTITATANTEPGDGDVTAAISLAPPPAGALYALGAPADAKVTIADDDVAAPVSIPTLNEWGLLLLGVVIALGAAGSRAVRR